MDAIMDIAERHKLLVIEDAAQGIMATYKGRPLGAIGHLGCLSFHETKNIIAGEGGALLINDERFAERAEIIREKGTNRSQFFRGMVDKYTRVEPGSSYLPGELIAAFLYAQMEEAEFITRARLASWDRYHELFADLEATGQVRRTIIPSDCQHNAHMYYLLVENLEQRNQASRLAERTGHPFGVPLRAAAQFSGRPTPWQDKWRTEGYRSTQRPTAASTPLGRAV